MLRVIAARGLHDLGMLVSSSHVHVAVEVLTGPASGSSPVGDAGANADVGRETIKSELGAAKRIGARADWTEGMAEERVEERGEASVTIEEGSDRNSPARLAVDVPDDVVGVRVELLETTTSLPFLTRQCRVLGSVLLSAADIPWMVETEGDARAHSSVPPAWYPVLHAGPAGNAVASGGGGGGDDGSVMAESLVGHGQKLSFLEVGQLELQCYFALGGRNSRAGSGDGGHDRDAVSANVAAEEFTETELEMLRRSLDRANEAMQEAAVPLELQAQHPERTSIVDGEAPASPVAAAQPPDAAATGTVAASPAAAAAASDDENVDQFDVDSLATTTAMMAVGPGRRAAFPNTRRVAGASPTLASSNSPSSALRSPSPRTEKPAARLPLGRSESWTSVTSSTSVASEASLTESEVDTLAPLGGAAAAAAAGKATAFARGRRAGIGSTTGDGTLGGGPPRDRRRSYVTVLTDTVAAVHGKHGKFVESVGILGASSVKERNHEEVSRL